MFALRGTETSMIDEATESCAVQRYTTRALSRGDVFVDRTAVFA